METEHEIQKTLNELKDTTKMIIAHRISAVCHADEIIYLKDGEIAERGTHQELLAKRGLYYETYMAQYGTFLGGGDVMAVNSYREDEFMENTDKKKIMRRLFSYLLAYKGTIIAVLVCMGITVAISLVNPLLIEEAIDHYIAQSDLHGLIGLGIFALVLNLIFIVMVKLRMYAMAVISNKILLQIRQDLYEHIQTLSFSFLTADRPEKSLRVSSGMSIP